MEVLRHKIDREKLFQRPLFRNIIILCRDILFAYFVFRFFDTYFSDSSSIFVWSVYALTQGTVCFGLWVLAHECGHGAFSEYQIVNDTLGFIIHSALLVPYFAWQKTHSTHHARCSHLIDGETHVPPLRRKVEHYYNSIINTLGEDVFTGINLLLHLVLGWPLYILFHSTGSRRSFVTKERYKSIPNHFDHRPVNELFHDKLSNKIALGTAGVMFTVCILLFYSLKHGFNYVLRLYLGPYFVINAWLVTYTWLHHTSTTVPHYGEDEWTWMKGALSTIDRPYPWIIDELHHHIGSTHVCHHLFHELPHYNAVRATEIIREILESEYKYDPTPIHKALWKTSRDCQFVEDVKGVQFYKKIV